MEFIVDYFIEKFEAIPEEKWVTGIFKDKKGNCCALGHCGRDVTQFGIIDTEEASDLVALFSKNGFSVTVVNDSSNGVIYNGKIIIGSTPKERILNVLKSLKNG